MTTLADGPELTKPTSVRHWKSGLAATLILVILAAGTAAFWYLERDQSTQQTNALGALMARTSKSPPEVATAPATARALTKAPALTRMETSAATIIGDGADGVRDGASEGRPKDGHTANAATQAVHGQDKTPAPIEHSVAILRDSQNVDKQAAAADRHRTPSPAQLDGRASQQSATARVSKKPAPVVSKDAPPVADSVARQMDGDVSLLSALVSHATERDQKAAGKVTDSGPASTKK